MTIGQLERVRQSMMVLREDAWRLCRDEPQDPEHSALAYAYATASLRLLAEIIEIKINSTRT